MPEIRSMVNTTSRYFNVLLYNIKYTSNTPLLTFFANKWLNGAIGIVGDIKSHHIQQENSSTH